MTKYLILLTLSLSGCGGVMREEEVENARDIIRCVETGGTPISSTFGVLSRCEYKRLVLNFRGKDK